MNPCITIDVSKESSHIQGFLDYNKPIIKSKKIEHSNEGFLEIENLFNSIKYETSIEPIIIFEYTGCYHKTLQAYLESKNYKFSPIPPLLAAKVRKTELRAVKTDKRDCKTLSLVYYENKLTQYYKATEYEINLKEMNKYYCKCVDHYQMITTNLMEYLDIIYPKFKQIFSEFDCFNALNFITHYPHPSLLTSKRYDYVIKDIIKITNHSEKYSTKLFNKLFTITKSYPTGCNSNSFEVISLKELAYEAIFYKNKINTVIKEMSIQISNSDKKMLFSLLKDIPGIGNNLSARFIAEVQSLDRFTSHKKLVAYVGTDPRIYQSGTQSGLHLSITKCGNKRLRTLLYQMVRGMIKTKCPDSAVKDFYYKKKA